MIKDKICYIFIIICFFALVVPSSKAEEAPLSDETELCLDCHSSAHPGIVEDWKRSLHAQTTPLEGLKRGVRISAKEIPEELKEYAVGCAECHLMNPDDHEDSFDHAGYTVHTVVTPRDCAVCHPVEEKQFGKNLMSHAYGNLKNNPLFMDLADSINGLQSYNGANTTISPPDMKTNADSCFSCHGTKIEVKGEKFVETDFDEMNFPVLEGWPNQGVGRINPDGSKGSCTSCHTRHQFSMAMARKPSTCSQCHKGPDVPAYSIYKVSKHGNIYSSNNGEWNFDSLPWVPGKDFTAPTCASCHVSLLVDTDDILIAKRTHQMNDRLYTRLFGLIYAHPHPESPDTTIIRNNTGLPLPTELTGEPANDFLISKAEQDKRKEEMQSVCLSCHASGWVDGHFERLDNTIQTTNQMTLEATKILLKAWEKGAAMGLDEQDSIFNEGIERKWVEQWLFYANSVRFASAMAGADYGVFANGRYFLSKNIQDMIDWLEIRIKEDK